MPDGSILRIDRCTRCFDEEWNTVMTPAEVHSKDKSCRDVFIEFVKEDAESEVVKERSLGVYDLE